MQRHSLLVTGGAGFIGSNLIAYLLTDAEKELGLAVERIVNLDKLTYSGRLANLAEYAADPRLTTVQGDICDPKLVDELFRGHAFTGVLHLAAETHVDRSIDGPDAFVTTNVTGTLRLLEAFRQHGERSPGAFLHASTDEIYGDLTIDGAPFTETSAYSPNSPYAASKAAADHLVRAFHRTYGLPTIIAHCSNSYGPFQHPEKLVPLMVLKALRGHPLPLYGDGSNIRDWMHVADACRGLVAAWFRGKPGQSYNLSGGCERSNLALVEQLLRVMRDLGVDGADASRIEFVADRPGHDFRYAMRSAKAQASLGWRPVVAFEAGLEQTVRWYLEHPDWIGEIERHGYRGERLGLSR